MGRDTVQLETAVNTISQEYLLEFTLEYDIPKALHPELPGPEDRIVDFPKGKRFFPTVVDWRTSAPKDGMSAENTYSTEAVRTLDTHRTPIQKQPEIWTCLIRAPNPTKMEDLAAATDLSTVPSTIERSPLDFDNEAGAADQGTMALEVSPPEDVPTTRGALEAGQAEGVATTDPSAIIENRKRGHDESLAAIELGMASTRPVPVLESAPANVSDPDSLSFADPQSRHPADVAQSSQGTAAARDPESKNASFAFVVGSPENLVDHVAPPGYFSELRHLHNDDFLRQYNVNLARQVALGSQLRLRFEQDAKLLKKSVAQVAHRDKRIQAREYEIKNLEALLEAEADMKKAAEEKNAKLSQELENMRALFSDL
nr:hypothetical protein [Tanacetum cinerariifolium]